MAHQRLDPTRAGFFDLPRELRDSVYERMIYQGITLTTTEEWNVNFLQIVDEAELWDENGFPIPPQEVTAPTSQFRCEWYEQFCRVCGCYSTTIGYQGPADLQDALTWEAGGRMSGMSGVWAPSDRLFDLTAGWTTKLAKLSENKLLVKFLRKVELNIHVEFGAFDHGNTATLDRLDEFFWARDFDQPGYVGFPFHNQDIVHTLQDTKGGIISICADAIKKVKGIPWPTRHDFELPQNLRDWNHDYIGKYPDFDAHHYKRKVTYQFGAHSAEAFLACGELEFVPKLLDTIKDAKSLQELELLVQVKRGPPVCWLYEQLQPLMEDLNALKKITIWGNHGAILDLGGKRLGQTLSACKDLHGHTRWTPFLCPVECVAMHPGPLHPKEYDAKCAVCRKEKAIADRDDEEVLEKLRTKMIAVNKWRREHPMTSLK
ncbi:hypothetical protein EJ08DRAFT_75534 [Tothia fuscella]|uniref:Uncharacterized protein n=1 Tax=Tothia fuscella TaxID=1048955 RepID=A0A9P4U1W8_9PEZI|nr:hypothetical protein EJ08DRAFT_75534 [Tothia fuscella]